MQFLTFISATIFRIMKPRPPEEEHLHLLGPPIKVEVGDNVKIEFMNKASRPYSFFPHGVAMEKKFEGSVYYLRNSGKPSCQLYTVEMFDIVSTSASLLAPRL